MKNSSKKIIAVCLWGSNDNYQSRIINGLIAGAGQMQMELLFFTALGDETAEGPDRIGEQNIYYLINTKNIDGVILLAETIKDRNVLERILESIKKQNLPAVSIDMPLKGCYNILFEYKDAMKKIVRHFVEDHQYRVIEYIGGIEGNPSSQERLDAFYEVMNQYQLTVEPERIHYGGYCEEKANKVMDEILSSKNGMPEAIICANDTMALTVISRLLKAGFRVPEQVAVSGFDGIKEAMDHLPTLTTACQDFKRAASFALDILFNIFHHITEKTDHYVPFKILYGESCCLHRKRPSIGTGGQANLYRKLYENEQFTKAMVHMSGDLIKCGDMFELAEKLESYQSALHTQKMWICLIPEYREEKEEGRKAYYQSGYPGGMIAFLYKKGERAYERKAYPVEEIIPDLRKEENILLMPLHALDKALGYMAVTLEADEVDYNQFYAFSMVLSNGIEVVKNRMEQTKKMERLQEKYSHDLLTGLFNRRGFFERVTKIYQECVQNGEHLMLISVDLDGLKYINDTYGHAEGDQALVAITKVLKSISHKNEICARFGGDEFIVAGRIPNDIDYMKEYNERLRAALREHNKASGKCYKIEASCGVFYDVPSSQTSVDDFIREADTIMYNQKEKNRKYRSYVRV
ncbi:MAG: GGDEF domain-containing protein [Lachnospiraceae bacterium]|nr:GGDEF domain-containing protein [Lachnospiraceae bacterium]